MLGIDDLEPVGVGSSGGTSAAGGTSGTSSGGGAGGGCVPGSCPGEDGECGTRICLPDDTCGIDAKAAGTPCSGGSGWVCDGAGYCVDPQCTDGKWNGDETATDCGGPSCGPCAKGELCKQATDCGSGFCVDGVCCESACDGVCESCVGDKTGTASGLCAPVSGGTDPDDECGDADNCVADTCDGVAGSCAPAEQGTVCRAATGNCDVAEKCDGVALSCPMDVHVAAGTDPSDGCGYLELCDGAGACKSLHRWSKRFGDAGNETGYSVATDAAGNALVAVRFNDTVDFGGGGLVSDGEDGLLAKFDPSGKHVWGKPFGGTGTPIVSSVAVDATGNTFLTGELNGTVDFGGPPLSPVNNEAFLAKLDASGTHLWSKCFCDGDGIGYGKSVAADATGSAVVAGHFLGAVDFGGGLLTSAGSHDIFLAKYDSSGKHLWSKRFGASNYDTGESVALDGNGDIFLAGSFEGIVDFGGGPLATASPSDAEIFIVKLDGQGNHTWSKQFGGGGTSNSRAYSIAVDSKAGVVITGDCGGTIDFGGGPLTGSTGVFLAKLDAAGNHQWSKRVGSASKQRVAVDAMGNVFLTGYFSNPIDLGGGSLKSAGLSDFFLAKFDAAGKHVWSDRIGGSGTDQNESLAVDTAGNAFLTGYFCGTLDLGGGPLVSDGCDIFVVKYGL